MRTLSFALPQLVFAVGSLHGNDGTASPGIFCPRAPGLMTRGQCLSPQLHPHFDIFGDDLLAPELRQNRESVSKELISRICGGSSQAFVPRQTSSEKIVVRHRPAQAFRDAAGSLIFGRLSHHQFSQTLTDGPLMSVAPHCGQVGTALGL